MDSPLRLISFSLYGDQEIYLYGILRNLIVAPVIYPGWKVVVFHDDWVPEEIIQEIRRLNGIPVKMGRSISPAAYRFVAATLPGIDRVIFRDADSRLSWREREAVDEWMASEMPFHAMRDHPWHRSRILAGMWGCRGGTLPGLRTRLRHYPWPGRYGEDEDFLLKEVWSGRHQEFLVHDSHSVVAGGLPFPSARHDHHFIGEKLGSNGQPINDSWKMLRDLPGSRKGLSLPIPPAEPLQPLLAHRSTNRHSRKTLAIWITNARDGLPHLDAFVKANPDLEVHVVNGPERIGTERRQAWRNCDLSIKKWWDSTGKLLSFTHAVFLEWDVLFNASLDSIFEDESDADFLVPQVVPRGSDWPWWKEVGRLPDTLKPHACGITPLAVMRLSRRCLEAMFEHPLQAQLYEMDLFCELRFPTLATACGYEPQASRGLRQVHWQDCPVPAKEQSDGVFHPVKSPQSIKPSVPRTCESPPPCSHAAPNVRDFVLIPEGGLGNRLRAIASAKRLGQLLDVSITVIWEWGHWQDLFEEDPGLCILPSLPDRASKFPILMTRWFKDGGEQLNQQLRFPEHPGCILRTCHCFSFEGLPAVTPNSLADHYPRPSASISQIIQNFISQHFLKPTVGVHIRRTDHVQSIQNSPDHLFEEAINKLVTSGYQVLLCTDNVETLSRLRQQFGTNLLHRPKVNERATRWPRNRVELDDLRDDWIDLLLLSRCDHVLGSWSSSFSEMAIALNRSPKSRCLQVSTANHPS